MFPYHAVESVGLTILLQYADDVRARSVRIALDERELSDLLYNTPLPRVEDLVHATTDPRAWIDSRMRSRGWGDWLAAVPV